MMLPSITLDMIQERMSEVWTQAQLAWKLGHLVTYRIKCKEYVEQYDYLSHWQNQIDFEQNCIWEEVL